MEELEGKLCRGFKFSGFDEDGSESWIKWYDTMAPYINEVGEIVEVDESDDSVRILFNDGHFWWYPLDQVKEHLVGTIHSQKVLTPLDKLMSFLIDKQYFIGNDLYEEFKKLQKEEKELLFDIACRGIYGMSSEADAKKYIDGKFE
jgi:hypothetical protein